MSIGSISDHCEGLYSTECMKHLFKHEKGKKDYWIDRCTAHDLDRKTAMLPKTLQHAKHRCMHA